MKRTRKDPPPLDAAALEKAALAYLDRFDSSAENLRRRLRERVRRAAKTQEIDEGAMTALVDHLVARYQSSGLLDDARYAESLARGLRARGGSRRGIEHKLRAKGVGADTIDGALARAGRDSADAELDAARAFARRRRLGPHRPADQRAAKHRSDLGALARAGFSFDVARRVLGPLRDDEDLE